MAAKAKSVRVLGRAHQDAALALLQSDPVINVFVHHRALMTHLDSRWLGGEMWGWFIEGRLVSLCHVAANVVPVAADAEACAGFAARLIRERPDFVTLLGAQDQVRTMWESLQPHFAAPKDERWRQPHLEIDTAPAVPADPAVRRTPDSDVDVLYPACVAMYTEEVGVSPESHSGKSLYRARVRQLVSRGWSFSRIEDGEVVFKAEVACATPYAAQVQGVYVAPHRRGEGIGAAGMAAVVEQVRAEIAPTVSLYVNDHNAAARAAYARVGFEQTATFSTLLF